MRIYTKTGDDGTTSLIGGERVKKYDPRVEAYGTVDELMSFIALLADKITDDERTESLAEELRHVECRLMSVSALLAVGKGGEGKVEPLKEECIAKLEQSIDRLQGELKPITKFTSRVATVWFHCATYAAPYAAEQSAPHYTPQTSRQP